MRGTLSLFFSLDREAQSQIIPHGWSSFVRYSCMYHATATAVAALRKKTASKLHYTSWSLRNRYVPIFKVQNNHFPLHVFLFLWFKSTDLLMMKKLTFNCQKLLSELEMTTCQKWNNAHSCLLHIQVQFRFQIWNFGARFEVFLVIRSLWSFIHGLFIQNPPDVFRNIFEFYRVYLIASVWT